MVGGSVTKNTSANGKKPVQPAQKAEVTDMSFEREVQEQIRNEKLKKLWDNYGTYAIGAVVAFVLSIGIYQQVVHSQLVAAQTAGARYEAARQLAADNKAAEAATAFAAIAKDGPKGYATLARLQQAAADAQSSDKTAQAVTAYEAIAADTGADSLLRDLARLQAAALLLDAADWTEMQNRLTPLVDERNAFRANARELLGLAARKANRTDDARKLFIQILCDSKASKSLKDRASGYMTGIVAADLGKTAAPVAAPAAPAPAEPTKK